MLAASPSAVNTTLPDASTVRTSPYPRSRNSAARSALRIVIPFTFTRAAARSTRPCRNRSARRWRREPPTDPQALLRNASCASTVEAWTCSDSTTRRRCARSPTRPGCGSWVSSGRVGRRRPRCSATRSTRRRGRSATTASAWPTRVHRARARARHRPSRTLVAGRAQHTSWDLADAFDDPDRMLAATALDRTVAQAYATEYAAFIDAHRPWGGTGSRPRRAGTAPCASRSTSSGRSAVNCRRCSTGGRVSAVDHEPGDGSERITAVVQAYRSARS